MTRLSVEDDATPIVRALARDLSAQVDDSAFAQATAQLHGTVVVRDAHTPQAVTLRVDEQGISLAHGAVPDAEVTATVQFGAIRDPGPDLAGAEEQPELAEWITGVLRPPEPAIEDAGARFWSALEPMSGAPRALLVVDLDAGSEHRFGAEDTHPYELRGRREALVAVLTGRTPLVDAAFEGAVAARGSFPELSVLTGAGFRVRYGNETWDD